MTDVFFASSWRLRKHWGSILIKCDTYLTLAKTFKFFWVFFLHFNIQTTKSFNSIPEPEGTWVFSALSKNLIAFLSSFSSYGNWSFLSTPLCRVLKVYSRISLVTSYVSTKMSHSCCCCCCVSIEVVLQPGQKKKKQHLLHPMLHRYQMTTHLCLYKLMLCFLLKCPTCPAQLVETEYGVVCHDVELPDKIQ